MGRGRGVQGGGSIPTGCRPGVEETSTVVSQEEKGASRRPVLLRCQQVGGVSQNRGVRDSAISRPQVTLNFAT